MGASRSGDYDFDFDIYDVCSLLDLKERRRTANSMYVDCPFCNNGKKGKLNINFEHNVYRCNYNPEHSGGMLDLYARLHNITMQDAYREITETLRVGGKQPMQRKPPAVSQSQLASLDVRHQTYSMLLQSLFLTAKHKSSLLARGLTGEQIERNGYASTPAYGYAQLAKQLQQSGCQMEGVPGFYRMENGEWTINFSPYCSGFLIPMRWIDGRIQGIQIRLDRPIDDCKYIWLSSSDKRDGVSSGGPIHFVGNPQSRYVYVTEGGLKGDVTHAKCGCTMLCIAGVTQLGSVCEALQRLKTLGLTCIVEANDMDKYMSIDCLGDYGDKCADCAQRSQRIQTDICPRKQQKRDNIQAGCRALHRLCAEEGLACKQLVWDMAPDGQWAGNLKGIDDFQTQKC